MMKHSTAHPVATGATSTIGAADLASADVRNITRELKSVQPAPVGVVPGPRDASDVTNEDVARAQGGNTEAFGRVYQRFAPEIERYLMRKLDGRRDLAEDLAAGVFLKAFEGLGSYQPCGLPFAAWLYRVARNHLVDYLRAQHSRAASSLERVPAAAEVADPGAARDYGQVLDRVALGPSLARLSSDQRRALELRFLDGLPTAATAALMGKTEHAVKKLQARGLASLRVILDAGPPEDATRHAIIAA